MTQERYIRQIVLPEWGVEGQKALNATSILCVGAGGLGSPALLYLAAAGAGHIGIVDDDDVDISNLQRQILFKEADQGHNKAERAAIALRQLNSDIVITPHNERLRADNVETLLQNYAIVIDGSDNVTTKFLINDACVKLGKPLVYGAVLGFSAQISVFWPPFAPCYRCLYPAPPKEPVTNCATAGVMGAMAGMIGSIQALEALKIAVGLPFCQQKGLVPLLGKLWLLDAKTMDIRTLTLPKNPDCPVCRLSPEHITLRDIDSPSVCSTLTQDIIPLSVDEAKKQLNHAVFIDVRENREQVSGMIPHARALPLGKLLSFTEPLDALPVTTPIVVYCQHGIRSLTGANHLKSLGYTNVSHLQGGMARWEA